MMEEHKSSHSRVTFALLCGLAVCCSVMYITADGGDEFALEDAPHHIGSGQDTFTEDDAGGSIRSVHSTDVMKTGLLYTKTPDTEKVGPEGRERLLDFLNKVESNIAKEVASRENDILQIRTQMAKNMALNQEARNKMKKMLLAKMAVNAKQAKDDLAEQMRITQKNFADVKALENKRNTETIERNQETRRIMLANKQEAAANLAAATATQQKALATLDQQTNARIKQTDAAIHANAAQIVTNAKKARDDLDNAMGAFDNKMNNIAEEAKKGRSKLAAQAATQDKKFRTDSNNKLKTIMETTAKQFATARKTMADDRAHADAQLSHTTARLDAALHASAALQDKRFATTVADIASAKKEASDRVADFQTQFKASTLALTDVVEEQSKKLNARATQLAGVVSSDKAEQAHLNSQIDAENRRIQKVGQERFAEHVKKDADLKALMAANKADTNGQMEKMRKDFNEALKGIKAQMKKDRASHEAALSGATSGLFSTLTANKKAQDTINGELTAATKAAEMKAKQDLKEAKEMFATKIGGLTSTVQKNEKKHTKKVLDLQGIVEANAIKDAKGRDQLKKTQQFNHNQIKNAVSDAIHKGEQRALAIETKMAGVNKKMVEGMNNRITTEISALSKQIHGQINELRMDTKEARAQMKAEILREVSDAKKLAAQNLKDAVAWSEGEFTKLHAALEAEETLGGEERKAAKAANDLHKTNAENRLIDAVSTQAQALLTYRQEMCEEIGLDSTIADGFDVDVKCDNGGGKTGQALKTEYEKMIANAEAVKATMKQNKQDLTTSLASARTATEESLGVANKAAGDRYAAALTAVQEGIEKATKAADGKFAQGYITMAKNVIHAEESLSLETGKLNMALAAAEALEDSRFSKTVKDISAAKADAAAAVADAKKVMLANIYDTKQELNRVQQKVIDDIGVVSGMIVSEKSQQAKIEKKNNDELARIMKKSNSYLTQDKRARGIMRATIEDHKKAAADEVVALQKEAIEVLGVVNGEQDAMLKSFKADVTEAAKGLSEKMAANDVQQQKAQLALDSSLDVASSTTAAALKDAEKLFASRVTSLTNVITANKDHFEKTLSEKTGIVMDWKSGSDADRESIRLIRAGQAAELNAAIVHAIQVGETKAKEVEMTANTDIDNAQKALMSTISSSVENMADVVFAAVQGNRGTISDNYLSLKAYAIASADDLDEYLKQQGGSRNLLSIGDLLKAVGDKGTAEVPLGEGSTFGGKVESLFTPGKTLVNNQEKIAGSLSKVNGLVNEYIEVLGMVKGMNPMGLGYYLISKLEMAMQEEGALEVDEIEGKHGQYVFINSAVVGLSSRLADFQTLAVKMTDYTDTLTSLTTVVAAQTAKTTAAGPTDISSLHGKEWQGN